LERPFHSVYYLNLARRPDRRILCERQLAELGWSDAQRVEAIDSTTLEIGEWVCRGAIAARPEHGFSPGVAACIASHFSIWTAILEAGGPDGEWVLILEDDFRVHPVLVERPDVWRAHWDALPPDAGLVLVGCSCLGDPDRSLLEVGEPVNRLVVRVRQPVYGAFAYAMTRRFVRDNLRRYFPLEFPLDSFVRKLGSVYALRAIDDELWQCETPPSFYRVQCPEDESAPVVLAGLVSVRASPSDIQYGRRGVREKLVAMLGHLHRGEHAQVLDMAGRMKLVLMRQLLPDLYLSLLEMCVTSCWYVAREEGRRHVEELLDLIRVDPTARRLLAGEEARIVGNLRFYGEDYAERVMVLLAQRGPG
jgi:hypothetical protein